MPMDPSMAPPQGQPAPGGDQSSPGGASQLVADTNSNLMKLMDMLQKKMPDEAQKLGAIVQAFQSFVDGLGQPAGQDSAPQGPPTTTPEQGGAKGAVPSPY